MMFLFLKFLYCYLNKPIRISPFHKYFYYNVFGIFRKPELLKGVYEMGFNAPSKIQETALPTLLADP